MKTDKNLYIAADYLEMLQDDTAGHSFEDNEPIALMHDYVRRANFTTKPRLQGKFSAFALFVHGYSFQIYCLGPFFYAKLRNFTIQNEAWWRNLLI